MDLLREQHELVRCSKELPATSLKIMEDAALNEACVWTLERKRKSVKPTETEDSKEKINVKRKTGAISGKNK